MTAKPRLTAAAIAAALALLTGCQPATTPTPTTPTTAATGPNVAPTYACTPEFGGTPKPCSKAQYDAMKKRDTEYANGEKIVRRLHAVDERVARSGVTSDSEYASLVTLDIYQATMKSFMSDKHAHRTVKGGSYDLRWVKRMRPTDKSSDIAFNTCVDMESVELVENGQTVGRAGIMERRFELKNTEHGLKVWLTDFRGVPTC